MRVVRHIIRLRINSYFLLLVVKELDKDANEIQCRKCIFKGNECKWIAKDIFDSTYPPIICFLSYLRINNLIKYQCYITYYRNSDLSCYLSRYLIKINFYEGSSNK